MKLKFLLPTLLAAFVAFASPAQAINLDSDIDMGKISCRELLSSSQDEIAMLIFWIDGYMSGVSDNTVLSNEWLEQLGTHLGTYCGTNQNHTIMQAIEAME